MNTTDKVLKIAAAEVGYLEKSAAAWKKHGAACLYEKTEYAGSDNYTKYGYEMHDLYPRTMDFPAAWCDAFVDWCFYMAYGDKDARRMLGGEFDDYTRASANLFIKDGRFYYARAGAKPKVGDQVFFAKSGTFTSIHHTGLVVGVTASAIETIEGNTSSGAEVIPNGGAVCRKRYALDNPRIYGYGRPCYDVVGWHWVYDSPFWFYQDEEGRNTYGWKRINETQGDWSHKYYFDNRGVMQTGITIVDGKKYYLQESGPLEGAMCDTDSNGALDVLNLPLL